MTDIPHQNNEETDSIVGETEISEFVIPKATRNELDFDKLLVGLGTGVQ